MKVTEHVKGQSNFAYFRAGNLWYRTDDTGFEFPVPAEDTTGATFDAQLKSMTLMRWIRKHVSTINEGAKPSTDQIDAVVAEVMKKINVVHPNLDASTSYMASIVNLSGLLNHALITRHPDLFDLDHFLSDTEPSADLKKRKLTARWTFEAAQDHHAAHGEDIEVKIINDLVDKFATDLREEMKALAPDQYVRWDIPVLPVGLILDCHTFEPVVTFLARYAIATRS